MTTAVTSSSAAGQAMPAAVVAASADTAASASPSASDNAGAATPVSSAPTLASGTVAALLAQQATDAAGGHEDVAPCDAAPQYTLPAAVIANMQAFATTAPTQYTDQINASAAILADGSTASDGDKLNAWIGLTQLLVTGSIYYAGNVADLQKAVTATNGSYEQRLAGVELQYNQIETRLAAPTEAVGGAVNGYQNQLTALNAFSDSDQQILLATMSAAGDQGFTSVYGWQAYASVDDWKAALQQQAAAFTAPDAAQPAAAAANTSAHASAKAAGDSDTGATSPLAKLLATTEASAGATSTSDIALQIITQAAHRTAKQAQAHQSGATAAATTGGAGSDQPQTWSPVSSAVSTGAGVDVSA